MCYNVRQYWETVSPWYCTLRGADQWNLLRITRGGFWSLWSGILGKLCVHIAPSLQPQVYNQVRFVSDIVMADRVAHQARTPRKIISNTISFCYIIVYILIGGWGMGDMHYFNNNKKTALFSARGRLFVVPPNFNSCIRPWEIWQKMPSNIPPPPRTNLISTVRDGCRCPSSKDIPVADRNLRNLRYFSELPWIKFRCMSMPIQAIM